MTMTHYADRACLIRPAHHGAREGHAHSVARRQKNDLPWRCGKVGRTVRNAECKARPDRICQDCSIPNILP